MSFHWQRVYQAFFSDKAKQRIERWIIVIAILSFLIHLLFIGLQQWGLLPFSNEGELLQSPIAATYTPFSFILIYEVYLLIYYLPQSISTYVVKQYEIITLIVIRRVFKDLANLELTADWFRVQEDLYFTYDLVATLLLFGLIYGFRRVQSFKPVQGKPDAVSASLRTFIHRKQKLALILIPIFIGLALWSLGQWAYGQYLSVNEIVSSIRDVNQVFFDEFFTLLIITDVLLLLFSLLHTDRFSTVIRNSGFIISTILIRLSFTTVGLLNTVLVVVAVAFGFLMLWGHHQYAKLEQPDPEEELA